MTPTAALYSFFNGFGVPAYAISAVPDKAALPYLTYDIPLGYLDEPQSGVVNLWIKTESESEINAKATQIADTIGRNGTVIAIDGGYIWIQRGSPFCQALVDHEDNTIKRRYINVTVEYLR